MVAMWAKAEKWGASFFCAKKDLSLFHLQNPPVYKALLGFSTDLRGEGNWQKELSFRAGEVECVHSGYVDAVECVLCDGLSRVCLCRFLTAAISSLSLQKNGNFLRCFWIKRWINFFEIPVFMRFKSNNYLIVQQKCTVFCGEKPASFFWRTGCDARIGNGWQADLRNASDGRRIGSEARAGFFLRPSQGGRGSKKFGHPIHSTMHCLSEIFLQKGGANAFGKLKFCPTGAVLDFLKTGYALCILKPLEGVLRAAFGAMEICSSTIFAQKNTPPIFSIARYGRLARKQQFFNRKEYSL